MAVYQSRMKKVFLFICLLTFSFKSVCSTRTKEKIYVDLKTQNACVRVLNGTHQIGCSSSNGGNVGVVHFLETQDDWVWVLTSGPHAPYIAVLDSVNFTSDNVRNLSRSGRLSGILVIDVNGTEPEEGFSADKSCPNDAYGMYHSDPDLHDCQKVQWNTAGKGLLFDDLGLPIFSITEASDVEKLYKDCYLGYNKPDYTQNKARTYPLCATQLLAAMTAAKDSETCIRRSNHVTTLNMVTFCDPLGDQNIVVTLKAMPNNQTRPANSTIVVATRMDSMGMFQNEYVSADTTVSGIVTLLATAQALWRLPNVNESKLDVMFVFFQGEAFDYIGSSRMVYEMNSGKFPSEFDSNDQTVRLQKINLTHINHFIELSQVGLRENGSLWMHVDPFMAKNSQMQIILQSLKDIGLQHNVFLNESDPSGQQPLPPASVQRFLMAHNRSFPAVVITDHKNSFSNKFYNSRFDTASRIKADDYPDGINSTDKYNASTTQSRYIQALATVLAHYIFTAAYNRTPTSNESEMLTADIMEVNHLLYCFLISPHCELFNMTVNPADADKLSENKMPYPFYVSVHNIKNPVTSLTRGILAYYTGQKVEVKEEDCEVKDNDNRFDYLWMQGLPKEPDGARVGMCYKSSVFYSLAKSPAFDISDYNWQSGIYSTWTESIWENFLVRMFLVSSQQFQTMILSVGVVLTLVSLVLVYFIRAQSDILFAQRGISREYLFESEN